MNRRLITALREYFTLGMIGQLPPIQIDGAMLDGPSMQAYLRYVANNASLANPSVNASAVTNVTTGALTLSPANCAQGVINAIVVASGGSANTNTTDTATNIINGYWPGVYVGATALLTIVNNNSGTMTLAGGTNVTITGTATIPTLALACYQATCTNLANPALPGAVSTNSTTTTAAVAANSTAASPSSIIPVTSATGINVGGYISWVNTDGTVSSGIVTAINSLAITVGPALTKPIASGAAVLAYNNKITFLRLYSTVTAVTAA
jgi:hypothetical protein